MQSYHNYTYMYLHKRNNKNGIKFANKFYITVDHKLYNHFTATLTCVIDTFCYFLALFI